MVVQVYLLTNNVQVLTCRPGILKKQVGDLTVYFYLNSKDSVLWGWWNYQIEGDGIPELFVGHLKCPNLRFWEYEIYFYFVS